MLHPVLERQIKKILGEDDVAKFPQVWQDFLKAISDTYKHNDEDRALIERSLDLSSKELSENNQKLRGNIAAEQAKTDELERMNKLMVDRELKMIELKREIEDLKRGDNQ